MDSVKLSNFLQTFFHAINDLPLITKIHSSEKHYHEHILARVITPNMLAGKKELEIFTNQDAESILKKQIDIQPYWTPCVRILLR